MKTTQDLPARLWLVNSLTKQRFVLRFLKTLRIEREMPLGAGDSEFVMWSLPTSKGLELEVCEAALVGRPYVEARSLPLGSMELLADGSRLWSGPIQTAPVDFERARHRDGCHFGASDSETSEKESGVFVGGGTILEVRLRGVHGAVPAHVTVGVELAVYTTRD